MKPHLDIDVTDPRKLERVRVELTRLLGIVEFALKSYQTPHKNGQADLIPAAPGYDAVFSEFNHQPDIQAVMAGLAKKFTTSDVIMALGEEGKANRNRVKLALKKAVESGGIRLVKSGEGRRPSEYERIEN